MLHAASPNTIGDRYSPYGYNAVANRRYEVASVVYAIDIPYFLPILSEIQPHIMPLNILSIPKVNHRLPMRDFSQWNTSSR